MSLGHDKGGGHGGHIKFTEKDPSMRHEGKEPHKLNIDSSPKNLQNYTKRVPKKLKDQVYEDVTGNYSGQRPINWEDYLNPNYQRERR